MKLENEKDHLTRETARRLISGVNYADTCIDAVLHENGRDYKDLLEIACEILKRLEKIVSDICPTAFEESEVGEK